MFQPDGTFNFHQEIMDLAETFCQEYKQRQGPFKNRLEEALVLNFALCTIKHDLEQLLDHLEWQPVFKNISPREVYERGQFGAENPKGLSDGDVLKILEKALQRLHRN